MANKKDLGDLPGIGNSDSQVPFPSYLLAGHQWSRDAGPSGSYSEDARHARLSTGYPSSLLVSVEESGRSVGLHGWRGSEAGNFSTC